MGSRYVIGILLCCAATANGQLDSLQGLNSLQEVPLTELTQQDDNPLGRTALALHPDEWKHAEGEHFIYHYVRRFVATRAAVEAEFNFRVITAELERETLANERKCHIYFFDQAEDWQQFQKAGELEPWSGGIHSAGSLFLLRDPAYKFSGNALGHEITHLLLSRAYGAHLPRWLNEGFAEYISRNSRASYQRARGYLAKPHSGSFAPGRLMPVELLTSLAKVPNDHVNDFYAEAERLVRFLATSDKARFLSFLAASATGEVFDQALLRIYAGTFASRSDFEAKFQSYASKDYGTSLQDQP